MRTLVPRVVGQIPQPPRAPSVQWDEASFFRTLEGRRGAEDAACAGRVLGWARRRGMGVGWGKGRLDGSFTPELRHGGTTHKFVRLYTYGGVEVLFEYLMYQPPFDDESLRLELLGLLNGLPGANIPEDKITKRPTIDLGLLKDESIMEQFLGTLDWVAEEIGRS